MSAYRPDIDGLRAIAVMLVFLFHLDFHLFSGGYIGVDVFFVISGYLITQIIKLEFETTNSFSFKNFYIRRMRRLMPAFYFVVFGSLLAGIVLFSPADMLRLAKSSGFAVSFMSNFAFWHQSSYFDVSASLKPLLHTWSLSVEEQFYFFWPLFLVILLKLRSKKTALLLFTSVALISFALNPLFSSGDIPFLTAISPKIARQFEKGPATIFFLPFFRFFEFLIGAALVWLPNEKFSLKTSLNEAFLCTGLGLLFYSAFTYTDKIIFPSFNALLPCFGTALIIYARNASRFGILLRNSIAVWIGKRSYSLYLIHWPLIVFFKYWTFKPLTFTQQATIFVVALLASNFMFYYIETPFRLPREGTLRTRGTNLHKNFLLGRVPKVSTKAKYLSVLMHLKTLQPFYHIV